MSDIDHPPIRVVLLGHPVAHSLSPVFQTAAMRAAGLHATYEAVDVAPEDLDRMMETIRQTPLARGNVTVPHKERFAALCDELTPMASHVGAVNTFWVANGGIVGDNTDVGGFHHAAQLLLGRAPRDLVVGVLGAGGAAAAVLAAIEQWPNTSTLLWNRTPARARALAARFQSVACVESIEAIAARAHLVVNTTTLGMRDTDVLPVDPASLSSGAAVLDLVYRRGETELVRQARARGLAAAGGLEMLIEQGALAFERWFGRSPDRAVMSAAAGHHRG